MTLPPSEEYYTELERRLRALDGLVERLVQDICPWYREYLDVGEYGLAVEIVAERLSADMPTELVRPLARGLLAEAERMSLEEAVVVQLQQLVDALRARDEIM